MSASQLKRRVIALIVAGGKGERYHGDEPKQYSMLSGMSVLRWAVEAFATHSQLDELWLVHPKGDKSHCEGLLKGVNIAGYVEGGGTRQASVKAGLNALDAGEEDIILIHDAARPMVSHELISRVMYRALESRTMVLPALPVTDTLKVLSEELILDTVSRERLVAVQTPQAAPYGLLKAVHNAADTQDATDDAMLFEAAGHEVLWVEGEVKNRKLTTQDDKLLMEAMMTRYETRVGLGIDVHQLIDHPVGATIDEQHIILGGLKIPHTKRLEGHSDADVVLHAIVDALLGAMGEGDIGEHFPPNNMAWKGADSVVFVKHAKELLKAKLGEVVNLDVTIVSEAPKIAPYRDAIRQKIANALSVMPESINVKATTTERLGFTGRGEGIAAHAIISVKLPVKE